MSFTSEIKQEMLKNKWNRSSWRSARAYGLFAFGRAFHTGEVSLRTESEPVAALYEQSLHAYAGKRARIQRSEQSGREKRVFQLSLPDVEDRERLLQRFAHEDGMPLVTAPLAEPEALGAFLTGAFLACGNASDPAKGYHLEFVVRDHARGDELRALLDGCVPGAKRTQRRGAVVIYYKDSALIEDLLTLLGASKSALAMIEVEIIKDVRNKAMRVTNCETANIDKLVRASAAQTDDIELVLRRVGLESLPEALREAALLRLENPELSLRELAGLFPQPISRSGVHHRLDKLSKMAAELREQGEGGSAHG